MSDFIAWKMIFTYFGALVLVEEFEWEVFLILTESEEPHGHQLIKKLYRQCKAYERSFINTSLFNNNDTETEPFCPVVFDGYLE